MKKLIISILIMAGFGVGVSAQTMSGFNADDIVAQKRTQRALYETYTHTDDGLTSVFGFMFDNYVNQNLYYAIAIYGAVGGNANRGGYGLAVFGLGYNYPLTDDLYFDTSFMAGSGGGGFLAAGGGYVEHFQYGLQYMLTQNWGLELNFGHLAFAPNGFSTPIYSLGVAYRGLKFIVKGKDESDV
jgi:hypothetical protein